MQAIAAQELLRPGLLVDLALLLVGSEEPIAGGEAPTRAIRTACAELGARTRVCELGTDAALALEEESMDAEVEGTLAQLGRVDLLVVDGWALFAACPAAPLSGCLRGAWNATRAVVNHALLPAERGGRIVYVAPAPGAGEHAPAARAGLENLARTLSIEWARHAITVLAIAPGGRTAASEVAALTAYLASPAGAYFSGCALELGTLA